MPGIALNEGSQVVQSHCASIMTRSDWGWATFGTEASQEHKVRLCLLGRRQDFKLLGKRAERTKQSFRAPTLAGVWGSGWKVQAESRLGDEAGS